MQTANHSLIKREVLISLAFDTLPHAWENDDIKLFTMAAIFKSFPLSWDEPGRLHDVFKMRRHIPTRVGWTHEFYGALCGSSSHSHVHGINMSHLAFLEPGRNHSNVCWISFRPFNQHGQNCGSFSHACVINVHFKMNYISIKIFAAHIIQTQMYLAPQSWPNIYYSAIFVHTHSFSLWFSILFIIPTHVG